MHKIVESAGFCHTDKMSLNSYGCQSYYDSCNLQTDLNRVQLVKISQDTFDFLLKQVAIYHIAGCDYKLRTMYL